MEIKLQETYDLAKSNKHRIEKLERESEDMHELIKTVAVMAEKQNEMGENLGEMKIDIKSIKEKPGKRWDAIVEKIIMLIIAALVGFILMKLGL